MTNDLERAQRDRWHLECEALVKAEWLKVKPDENAQRLRAEISMRFPDDELPDWAWDFLDIGIALASAAAERRGYDAAIDLLASTGTFHDAVRLLDANRSKEAK